jgi:hypothetical protein
MLAANRDAGRHAIAADETPAPVRPGMPDWRVDVRNFGRVAEASITMAPLVVLVGRNNSGKSYIASLLWSLLNIDDSWLDRQPAAPEWFKQLLQRGNPDEAINTIALQRWLNETIGKAKDRVASKLLSYTDATIGDVQLTLAGARDCFFRVEQPDLDDQFVVSRSREPRGSDAVQIDYAVGALTDLSDHWVLSALIVEAVDAAMLGNPHFTQARPIYLPAARTGLMLSLPFIVGDLLGTLGLDRDDREAVRLPQPTIQFLRQVVNQKGRGRPELMAVADFLERELLRGNVGRDASTTPTFSYTPNDGRPIPLHTASSMVSELAPFLLLLRSSPLDRGLVFEEPESHLHLSAQRQVARAIARLVNLGVPVVLTTHSDTFVQQLNILIALHGHPDRERLMADYGYTVEDLIDPLDARGYEFVDGDGGRTTVQAVPMVETGLVVSSLNDVLIELSEEAIATQDR